VTVTDIASPSNAASYRLIRDVEFGPDVVSTPSPTCTAAASARRRGSGRFVEIQNDVVVGERCKVQSHSFLCEGVTIGDEVFIDHGVVFVNDKRPRATTDTGALQEAADWELLRTVVESGASIGSGALVLGGVRIGAGTLVGAGAVVTRNVGPAEAVMGVPARAARIASA
jgi:UDP-2-acetamido-3-amino-2,3-dideoxy-glucuronate N-acetyltransferase